MATITVSLPSDGDTIDVANYNTPINTIVSDYNGNITNDNLSASAGIDGTKLNSTWTSYTPVVSTPVGTAPTYSTVTGSYKVVGGVVDVIITLQNTSGGTAGSGTRELLVTTPVAPESSSFMLGYGVSYEESGTTGAVFCRYASSTAFYFHLASTANIVANDQSSANRYLTFNLRYKAA